MRDVLFGLMLVGYGFGSYADGVGRNAWLWKAVELFFWMAIWLDRLSDKQPSTKGIPTGVE